MICIGLTGGIASGKSTVSDILRQLGAWIVDADKLARQVVEPGQPAWQDIVAIFGEGVLLHDGHLNRKAVGDMIFGDERIRQQLEAITHPRIRQAASEQLKEVALRGFAVAVLDVPLLIEVGWTDMVDTVWVVYVDSPAQIERLMERDGLDREQALARIASQMRLQDKLQYANVVIDNSNGLEETRQQVVAAWSDLAQDGKMKSMF